MNKVFQKINVWTDWLSWNWESVIFIIFITAILIAVVIFVLWASGVFYDEVESYDFTAQVYDKDHYTTQSISYISNGKISTPIIHTHYHYKVMWEDGGERGALEVGSNHYDLIKIGDFINIHCSVKADKQGELHYYYSFKGY